MVVHMESDSPSEVPVMKTSRVQKKKYIIVKNHLRELPIDDHKEFPCLSKHENSSGSDSSKKKFKKHKRPSTEVSTSGNETEISKSDLEELRSIYKECKAVVQKIETKYGHLLETEGAGSSKQKHNPTSYSDEECQCKANTKILFDEDGQQLPVQPDLDNHVCRKKLKRSHVEQTNEDQVAVEYEDPISLPDDLKSLGNILQSEINTSYRNKVIGKVKSLKQEHINEIRFNRPSLIEKLKAKTDSEEIFEFNGANLFSLPGYPDWK